MQQPPQMPIFYVVSDYDRTSPFGMQYSIKNVITVYECDLSEIDSIYNQHINPLQYGTGRQIVTDIYRRSPGSNLFTPQPLIAPYVPPAQPPLAQPKQEELSIEPEAPEDTTPYRESVWEL